MTEYQYTITELIFALDVFVLQEEPTDNINDFDRRCRISNIDKNIKTITAFINELRDYTNPFRYVTFHHTSGVNITYEITPDICNSNLELVKRELALPPHMSKMQQAIYAKYIDLDYHKQYKLSAELPIEMKINILYAESLHHIRNHYDRLPNKYQQVFKENKYNNIYDNVKSELLEKLNIYIVQKMKLLTIQ